MTKNTKKKILVTYETAVKNTPLQRMQERIYFVYNQTNLSRLSVEAFFREY